MEYMLSGTEAASNNRKNVLEQLRFNKKGTLSKQEESSQPSTISANSPSQVHRPFPPPQSRDATVPSRYFQTSSATEGRILVPNSSPVAAEPSSQSYRPYGYSSSYDVAAPSYSNPWAQPHITFQVDPLSAPSNFTTNGATNNAPLRRPWSGDAFPHQDDGPPRKKQNRGPSQHAPEVIDSPGSPEISRAGPRRRRMDSSVDISSLSDDSLPEVSQVLTGPSKSRLVKHRPTPSPAPAIAADLSSDHQFQLFKFSRPIDSDERIKAAWIRAGGVRRRAEEIIDDPSWSPTPTRPPAEKYDVGRVKEIEEANKALKAAVKEKGKRSMIYANRPALDTNSSTMATPTTSKISIDLTASPASPLTPLFNATRRKRVKKMVLSDSDEDFEDSDSEPKDANNSNIKQIHEIRALEYFNTQGSAVLQELTGCTSEQADIIVGRRPFESKEDLFTRLGQGRKKAGPGGISPNMFEDCTAIFEGYGSVDSILENCEEIGTSLRLVISSWTTADEKETPNDGNQDGKIDEGALSLRLLSRLKEKKAEIYLTAQPSLLSKDVQLKEYQLLGVNWLHLLYRRELSCILADEMGLGKTIQVISFLAYLKEQGKKGPHLIVVPSSTLENWCREFNRFAPKIRVQTYYAGKEERILLRQTLADTQRSTSKTGDGWEVLITTYALAQGDERDRKFFRKIEWDCCIFDEGHVLKNFQSQRYQSLLKFGSRWRLLLTGTPLQNNLQELVSLLNFILPDQFADKLVSLRAIFKVKGDAKVSLLSQERISRAKKMMTPFVLRRRKDQVLKDLPNKSERIEWCGMTDIQKSIYTDALQRSRKTVLDANIDTPDTGTPASNGGREKPVAKKKLRPKDKVYLENSSNVLMDLRKAASHPMLFRTQFTDDNLSGITRQLLKEPDFKKRGALFDIVKEDMSVMTDAELQVFCATYKSTRKFLKNESCYLEAGKVKVLLSLLSRYQEEGRKILIFSQFTQILDILQAVLKNHEIKFLVLTGSTPVDIRQTLVDEFTEDETIPVFLLSTKAGGMGINLTAASVVVMFDQDFNPHNDRQAQDRAYRIGQKRDVDVVKLISRDTIEEDILKLGETKLALDEAVAGDTDESAPEREMKTSLMKVLRRQFERQQEEKEGEDSVN